MAVSRRLAPLVPVVLLSAALLVAGCSGGKQAASPSSIPSSPVVVRVNGTPGTAADLARIRRVSAFTGAKLSRSQALRQLVAEVLITNAARRLGLTVKPSEVDARITQLATAAGGQKALRADLAQAGATMADLRAGTQAVLLGDKLQNAKFPAVRATTADARRFYAANRSLFTTSGAVDLGDIVMRSRPIAVSVRQRILSGDPFKTAAGQFNIDPQLRAEYGRLGWVSVPSLPASVRAATSRLKIGEISPVVHAAPYWHLLKLYGRRPSRLAPFSDVVKDLRARLTDRKRDAALARWVQRARAAAHVTTSAQ